MTLSQGIMEMDMQKDVLYANEFNTLLIEHCLPDWKLILLNRFLSRLQAFVLAPTFLLCILISLHLKQGGQQNHKAIIT